MKFLTLEDLAKSIVSVQPMDGEIFANSLKHAKTDAELFAAGYKPVSRIRLLWIKREAQYKNGE